MNVGEHSVSFAQTTVSDALTLAERRRVRAHAGARGGRTRDPLGDFVAAMALACLARRKEGRTRTSSARTETAETMTTTMMKLLAGRRSDDANDDNGCRLGSGGGGNVAAAAAALVPAPAADVSKACPRFRQHSSR